MTIRVDIIAGFLGAGKTTLIKKMLNVINEEEKVVVIENEFGEVSIDAPLLYDEDLTRLKVKEINAGCICCSFQGDFKRALEEVTQQLMPDRIIIEPTGVAKLSEVTQPVVDFFGSEAVINIQAAVIDGQNFQMYKRNFGDFYCDQIKNAAALVMTKTAGLDEDSYNQILQALKAENSEAVIIDMAEDTLLSQELLDFLSSKRTDVTTQSYLEHDLEHELLNLQKSESEKSDYLCHTHDEKAGTNFESWSYAFPQPVFYKDLEDFSQKIEHFILDQGQVLRAKGLVQEAQGTWYEMDFFPGNLKLSPNPSIQSLNTTDYGHMVVIGVQLNKDALNDFWAKKPENHIGDGY